MPAKKSRTAAEEQEIVRLGEIYNNLPPRELALAQGLIIQAARLRVQLDELTDDIAKHGLLELFRQSDKVEPYTRERPAAQLFAKLDKNYQTIINQLNDMISNVDTGHDDLADFRNE